MILTGLSLWLVNEVDKQDQQNNTPSYGSRINCAKILLEVEEYEVCIEYNMSYSASCVQMNGRIS